MAIADQLHPLGQKVPGGKILAVYLDDEVDVLASLAPLLETYGFEVFTTTSPDEALAVITRERARLGLILSDFNMPDVDGFEFRRRTLDAGARAPFIIYSGCLTKEMALRAIELKIAGFIEKPMRAAEFVTLLEREVLPFASALSEEAELLEGFLGDARTLIDDLEAAAADLAREPHKRDVLNTLFGTAHTLKGASGFFEPRDLHHYVHRFEDHLKRLQTQSALPTETELAAIVHAVDVMGDLLAAFTDPAVKLDVATLKTELDQHFENVAGPQAAAQAAGLAEGGERREAKDTFLKVETHVIDEFLKVSGEITIIRNMLKKTAHALGRERGADEEIQQLHDLLEELHKANWSMQKRVNELRKVSLASVLKPLPRVVRDVAQTLSKKVKLDTAKAAGRIDLGVADVIGKCIIHLVKNSIDHGLETPDVRRAAGKPEVGVIEIKATVGEEVVTLSIRDDGAGLNTERIRRKLLEKGFDPATVEAMSERQVHQMIFSPGFSTAAQTTELSGRGVGMSMVEETVKSIGGTIRIDSTAGRGSVFTLNLPVPKSVLIKSCLFVRVGRERFGLDQDQVYQVIESSGSHTFKRQDSAGVPLLESADGLISLLDARGLLGLAAAPGAGGQVVILQSEHHGRFGLAVDEVLDFADVVIKEVPGFLNRAGVYAGATFLEDRRVGLLVRSDGLAERARLPVQVALPPEVPVAPAETAETWITFEDLAGRRRAIRQDAVTRIEMLRPIDVSLSGAQTLLTYRGRVVRLIEGEDGAPPRALEQSLPILIVSVAERTLGLVVREILDVATAPKREDWPRTLLLPGGVAETFEPDQIEFSRSLKVA